MSSRAVRRRQQRSEQKASKQINQKANEPARVSFGHLDERTQLELAAATARKGLETGTKVVDGEGNELTLEVIEQIEQHIAEPRDPPDASVGWPENVAGHDQATAALRDFLMEEDLTPATIRQRKTLTEIGDMMPLTASASVVIQLDDGHVLATLLNQSQGPVVTLAYYGPDDPWRYEDPLDASILILADEA